MRAPGASRRRDDTCTDSHIKHSGGREKLFEAHRYHFIIVTRHYVVSLHFILLQNKFLLRKQQE